MAVSIQQAAMNALATWLQTKLGSSVSVESRWPDPEKPLPAKAVTITPGPWEDEILQPETDYWTSVANHPEQYTYRWRVLERTQPFQLDIWSCYEPVRDDMVKTLDDATAINNGVLLSLGDSWTGNVDFTFTGGYKSHGAYDNQQNEFRATYQGEARMVLYVDAVSARMATQVLRQTLDGVARAYDVVDDID